MYCFFRATNWDDDKEGRLKNLLKIRKLLLLLRQRSFYFKGPDKRNLKRSCTQGTANFKNEIWY